MVQLVLMLAIAENMKIQTIKVFREVFNLSLLEAKRTVEAAMGTTWNSVTNTNIHHQQCDIIVTVPQLEKLLICMNGCSSSPFKITSLEVRGEPLCVDLTDPTKLRIPTADELL
jgi:hypothetical protein